MLRPVPPPPPSEGAGTRRATTWGGAWARWAEAAYDHAADSLTALAAPLAWLRWRDPLDGPRLRGALARDLAPTVGAFVAIGTLLVAWTSTYFLFERLPRRPYTEALFLDDLLAGLGTILVRVVLPVLVSLMLAAKLGASAAAHLGHMSLTRQIDALRLLRVPLRRHLLLPAAAGQLAAAWVYGTLAYAVAYGTSIGVFLWTHPGWSALYVQRAWTREIAGSDIAWAAVKIGLSAVAVGAVAFRAGVGSKREPTQVVTGIQATLLRGLLLVLVIHAAFAFVEFR